MILKVDESDENDEEEKHIHEDNIAQYVDKDPFATDKHKHADKVNDLSCQESLSVEDTKHFVDQDPFAEEKHSNEEKFNSIDNISNQESLSVEDNKQFVDQDPFAGEIHNINHEDKVNDPYCQESLSVEDTKQFVYQDPFAEEKHNHEIKSNPIDDISNQESLSVEDTKDFVDQDPFAEEIQTHKDKFNPNDELSHQRSFSVKDANQFVAEKQITGDKIITSVGISQQKSLSVEDTKQFVEADPFADIASNIIDGPAEVWEADRGPWSVNINTVDAFGTLITEKAVDADIDGFDDAFTEGNENGWHNSDNNVFKSLTSEKESSETNKKLDDLEERANYTQKEENKVYDFGTAEDDITDTVGEDKPDGVDHHFEGPEDAPDGILHESGM